MNDQQALSPILEKIRKLLALSTSSNPHEAALAASKAQALLAEYNLELSQVQTSEPDARYEQAHLSTGSRVWRRQLLYVLAKYNFCQTVYDPNYKHVILIGERHNSEVVQYLYSSLVEQLEHMAVTAYRQSESEFPLATWKNSFFAGALRSIDQRLDEQQKQFVAISGQCRSLVIVKNDELQKAVNKLFPHLRAGRSRRIVRCDGYYDGIRAGRTVALNKALH
ncbi:DUF2786 domain-containing protein [Ktedonosporobacter rubrisoli]|uniref:DUF2786 domain-containing protein n=1 Tax=Ktedonosporobacter rubrisoli TaxID=2509675 RepID=A0A4P6JSZ9_KTERU|nr:DUF2786 domain-containing protein [Ktedonosporobacter rubrisoli]QBD78006.1 DUF2786 domain-containing protein [Ktedonosporobacter rubrisoli]